MKILIVSILILVLLTHYLRYAIQNSGSILGLKIIEIPNDIKCYFDEDRCDEGDIDTWSLLYFIISIVAGYILPRMHIQYIALSIIMEILMPYIGYSSRYIINPLVAITGYSIGNELNTYHLKYTLSKKY